MKVTLGGYLRKAASELNDRLGHSSGDEVLRAAAATLRGSLREVDTPGRLGGDEFAILLPDTGRDEAVKVLSRLHRAFNAEASARGWPIGYSIGSVTFGSAPASVDLMISLADRVMYEVKQSGKNSVLARASDEM